MESTLPALPFWFKQRQCKLEPVGDGVLKVTAPNQREAYLSVRPAPEADGRWQAAVRLDPNGPDLAVSPPTARGTPEAWSWAFELYRTHVIV
jgi:hypothetical protein